MIDSLIQLSTVARSVIISIALVALCAISILASAVIVLALR